MSYKDEIVIIIPALNPDENLNKLTTELHEAGFIHILLVDDGSNKENRRYFDIAKSKYGCKVITHSVNLGKGRALKSAFNYILNEYDDICMGAVAVDSDGQHSVQDTVKCAQALLENPNSLIMGCRNFTHHNIPFRSKFGNNLTCKIINLLCGIKISDTQTGLRGIPCTLMWKFMTTRGERYEFEMNMLIDTKENQIPIVEVPIQTIYIENNQTSHFNPLLDSMKIYAVFGRFILSSLSSFIVDILLFTFLVSIFKPIVPGCYILMSTIGSRAVSSIFNYIVNKNNVFKNKLNHSVVFVKYFTLCTTQLLASALCVSTLYQWIGINESIVKVIVDTVLFLISFQVQREWVFKPGKETEKK